VPAAASFACPRSSMEVVRTDFLDQPSAQSPPKCRSKRGLARLGTRSAGAVCRAADIQVRVSPPICFGWPVDERRITAAREQRGGASVSRFALRAIGINRMRQENKGTRHADSHRNQLNHRTHRSHASPRSIKGALPFQDLTWKNVFGTPGRRRNLAAPCDRLTAGFTSSFQGRSRPLEPVASPHS
jgi:hypothetical protein